MAKLYKINRDGGATYHATEAEAVAVLAAMTAAGDGAQVASDGGGDAAKIEAVEIDEVELREAAAKWLSWCAKRKAMALKREANRTAEQKAAMAKKVWESRKKNGTVKYGHKSR